MNQEPEIKIEESDYEAIDSAKQIDCEKEKKEREILLIELINKVDALIQKSWISYDLIEEEVSHGEFEYTIITQIEDLRNKLEMEREEIKKPLINPKNEEKDKLEK
ncbi:MAG: hypothetical protein MRERC_5c069 [Mycoplasmataceae bacterium RC_NB112A]|nr:MAG: hypothetical protein MRERC_5c069 [Mycoplasmataceae bacterium RC_NB112A]